MDLYEQHTEVAILGALRGHMAGGQFIDVGAERGSFAHALLAYGYGPAQLIEASPANADVLRRRFAANPDVTIHELAATARDDQAVLHLAADATGAPSPAQNSLRRLEDDDDRRWLGAVPVRCRSLDSLAATGEIPSTVSLVKIDVEGGDRDVIAGMRSIRCDALMLEFWSEVAAAEGVCPWTLDEICELLEPLGLTEFLYVHHRPDIGVDVVPSAAVPQAGDWGNLIFMTGDLHFRAAAAIDLVADMARRIRDEHASACEKEAQIKLLATAADERLRLIEQLDSAHRDREREIAELRAALDATT